MIEADQIHRLERVPQTRDPPRVTVFSHALPVVQRVAPQLAGVRKIVRRHARDHRRVALLVQQEELGVGPDLGRIAGDKDRHVAEDADPHLARPIVERRPLPEEEELAELDKVDLQPVLVHPVDEGLRLAHRQRTRPLVPRCAALAVADRPKQRVVREPGAVLLAEGGEPLHQPGRLGVAKPEVGPSQQTDLRFPNLVERDPFGRQVRHLGQFLFRQHAVFEQQLGADQQLIAGKGRDRGVRRIAGPRRVQRQDLPPRCARSCQPLDVGRGRRSEVADPEARRQTGWVEDDTCGSCVLH